MFIAQTESKQRVRLATEHLVAAFAPVHNINSEDAIIICFIFSLCGIISDIEIWCKEKILQKRLTKRCSLSII
jgi:hypothetical protein